MYVVHLYRSDSGFGGCGLWSDDEPFGTQGIVEVIHPFRTLHLQQPLLPSPSYCFKTGSLSSFYAEPLYKHVGTKGRASVFGSFFMTPAQDKWHKAQVTKHLNLNFTVIMLYSAERTTVKVLNFDCQKHIIVYKPKLKIVVVKVYSAHKKVRPVLSVCVPTYLI
jgi:hypothetical protein